MRAGRRYQEMLLSIATVGALVLVGSEPAFTADPQPEASTGGKDRLAAQLRQAIADQNLSEVLDTAPPGAKKNTLLRAAGDEKYVEKSKEAIARLTAAEPAPIHQMPNMDATVIELGESGRPASAANVLVSPQYPKGIVVPLSKNLSTDQVRWRKWDDAEWDNNGGKGTRDAVPGRENAPIDFTSPYPASILKLMVGFGVLRLVDTGAITLDDTYAYQPVGTPSPLCGGPASKTVRQFFDEMITVSSNPATCSLIKLMHDRKSIDGLNKTFDDLGLPMLQLKGTNPDTGGRWANDVVMNSLDTAKLLLLLSGAPGALWQAPDGSEVKRDVLSESSRAFYLKALGEQGLNQALSTTNWCGRDYPAPGIPQQTPDRWINADGTMTVNGRVYGQDVRPCNANAEVTFAHKTGYVDTAGGDAGIVTSLPGKSERRYIVVVHSNLGDRYIDPNRPADPPGVYPVRYTEKFGKLGHQIDALMTARR